MQGLPSLARCGRSYRHPYHALRLSLIATSCTPPITLLTLTLTYVSVHGRASREITALWETVESTVREITDDDFVQLMDAFVKFLPANASGPHYKNTMCNGLDIVFRFNNCVHPPPGTRHRYRITWSTSHRSHTSC